MTLTTSQNLGRPTTSIRSPLSSSQPRRGPSTPLALTEGNLPLMVGRVAVPGYDRSTLSTGVVHLGVGNFHRAHQAVYFDDLARLGMTGWGVTGIGMRSRRVCDLLPPQDLLYTVAELSGGGPRFRVVGALHRYLYAPDQPARALAALGAPSTTLVTLTLTGDGYPCDAASAELPDDVDLQHDRHHPDHPRTAFGYLVAALDLRRRTGRPGLTVLSCDNRPDSAAAARASVLALAGERDPALVGWIEQHVCFPDSMVDRITPATEDDHRRLVLEETGIADRWPVATETFRQWVVEDAFAGARPPLEEVGVQYVSDVRPWKQVKTRLLNGSHCALGYVGLLAGHADTATAMTDPLVERYLTELMSRETSPLLPELPGLDLPSYRQTLLHRFANPALADPLTRLAGRASTKLPAYLLPSLTEAVRQGRPHELLTLAVAAWIRCLQGAALVGGSPVQLADARSVELRTLALRAGTDLQPLLATGLLGGLSAHHGFVATLGRLLQDLTEQGLRPTLAASLTASRATSGG